MLGLRGGFCQGALSDLRRRFEGWTGVASQLRVGSYVCKVFMCKETWEFEEL